MSKKIRTEAVDQLFEAILCLKDKEECYTFFEDVCTINELLSLSQRFEVAKMLRDFNNQVVFFGINGRVGNENSVQNTWKVAFGKLQVNNRSDDLHYFTGINSTHALCPLILSVPRHRLRCPLIGW